jgi:L-alanine-DL-glutamate epimerase-like enolase superfamily enzyme
MTMGVAWAWPHATLDNSMKVDILVELAREVADALCKEQTLGHPLEIARRMAEIRDIAASKLVVKWSLDSPIPDLALLLATSPLEAALFDAQGKAASVSSYLLLGKEFVKNDLSFELGPAYRGRYLDEFVSEVPVSSLPLYHLVGALDPLSPEEVEREIGDGLPETLGQWIVRDGLTHLKIKLAGDDFDWDRQRILRIHEVATVHAVAPQRWHYSLDFNERCESADYVLQLLDAVEVDSRDAFEAIQYVEQPTHRDLASHPDNLMHAVARRVPVVIDESLTDLASLRLAVEQGYSGIALKACKGHSEALLMAAVARHEGLYLCVQDLTCIGASLLHSVSLASHIPGVVAVESNGRQYCPRGNEAWKASFPGMFDVRDGQVPSRLLSGAGLGY